MRTTTKRRRRMTIVLKVDDQHHRKGAVHRKDHPVEESRETDLRMTLKTTSIGLRVHPVVNSLLVVAHLLQDVVVAPLVDADRWFRTVDNSLQLSPEALKPSEAQCLTRPLYGKLL
jgi:hypothetical protein